VLDIWAALSAWPFQFPNKTRGRAVDAIVSAWYNLITSWILKDAEQEE
jgi:hypothetical protein